MYKRIIRYSTIPLPQEVCYMAAADSGYDDYKLYNLSIHRRGFELVCPNIRNKYTITILQVTDYS
jgi:hypothetical protein